MELELKLIGSIEEGWFQRRKDFLPSTACQDREWVKLLDSDKEGKLYKRYIDGESISSSQHP